MRYLRRVGGKRGLLSQSSACQGQASRIYRHDVQTNTLHCTRLVSNVALDVSIPSSKTLPHSGIALQCYEDVMDA